jgi:ATP-dependent RNA helicase DDX6/DHH1
MDSTNNQTQSKDQNKDNKQKEVLDTTGVKAPILDTRIKTDDVTATKGLTWADFGLCKELQLGIYEKGYENPSPI